MTKKVSNDSGSYHRGAFSSPGKCLGVYSYLLVSSSLQPNEVAIKRENRPTKSPAQSPIPNKVGGQTLGRLAPGLTADPLSLPTHSSFPE